MKDFRKLRFTETFEEFSENVGKLLEQTFI